jgi:uncharacterized protein (TIGR03382 family)
VAGFLLGFGGFVIGGLAFGSLALTLPEDPSDRIGGALGLALLVDVVPTLAVPVVGLVWLRTRRRRAGWGALLGLALGLVLTVAAAAAILWITKDWPSGCPDNEPCGPGR